MPPVSTRDGSSGRRGLMRPDRGPKSTLRKFRKRGMMNLSAEPVEFTETHDQWPPLVGVDTIAIRFHQNFRMRVNTNNPQFDCHQARADSGIFCSKIAYVLDHRF